MAVHMGGSSIAKKNTGIDTRLESTQMQPTANIQPYKQSANIEYVKKQTPWKMPEFKFTINEEFDLPEGWSLYEVIVPQPYKDNEKALIWHIKSATRTFIFYNSEECIDALRWLRDNESFKGYHRFQD